VHYECYIYACVTVSSHTLIGAFSTTMRELSQGPCKHNEYPVSVAVYCLICVSLIHNKVTYTLLVSTHGAQTSVETDGAC